MTLHSLFSYIDDTFLDIADLLSVLPGCGLLEVALHDQTIHGCLIGMILAMFLRIMLQYNAVSH
jgi:hypothetical protein